MAREATASMGPSGRWLGGGDGDQGAPWNLQRAALRRVRREALGESLAQRLDPALVRERERLAGPVRQLKLRIPVVGEPCVAGREGERLEARLDEAGVRHERLDPGRVAEAERAGGVGVRV